MNSCISNSDMDSLLVSVGRKHHRHYVTWLLGLSALLLGLAGLFNWIVDPLYFYHRPWFEIGFSKNQRLQNPGIARQFDYEAVMLGTSRIENFRTSSLQQALGLKIINLPISASTATEQALLLDVVFQNQPIRRVVWEINYPSFALGDRVRDDIGVFPYYLYHEGLETPFRYLLSQDTLFESFQAISGQRPTDLDTLHFWANHFEFSQSRVMAAWDSVVNRWTDDLRDFWAKNTPSNQELQSVFVQKVERAIQQHPDVEFDLLLLPLSMLGYGSDFLIASNRLEKRLSLLKTVVQTQTRLPNVRVFNFQLDEQLTHDFSRWKDLEHFDAATTAFIIDALARGDYQVTPPQLLCATGKLRQNVLTYMAEYCATEGDRCPPVVHRNMQYTAAQPWDAPCPDD